MIVGLISWSLARGHFPIRYPQLAAATYGVKGISATLLLFLSMLAHEFGHALTEEPRTGRDELRIAAAGPFVSLLAAGLFYAVGLARTGVPEAVARLLVHLNLVLVVFNLVPAFPLDGGRILRAVLWSRQGRVRARRTTVRIGTVSPTPSSCMERWAC